jgi:hypothetical protein
VVNNRVIATAESLQDTRDGVTTQDRYITKPRTNITNVTNVTKRVEHSFTPALLRWHLRPQPSPRRSASPSLLESHSEGSTEQPACTVLVPIRPSAPPQCRPLWLVPTREPPPPRASAHRWCLETDPPWPGCPRTAKSADCCIGRKSLDTDVATTRIPYTSTATPAPAKSAPAPLR